MGRPLLGGIPFRVMFSIYSSTRQLFWVQSVSLCRLFRSGLERVPCVGSMDGLRGKFDCPTSSAASEICADMPFFASCLRRECISLGLVSDTGEPIPIPIPNNDPAAVRHDVIRFTVKAVPDPHQIWTPRPR